MSSLALSLALWPSATDRRSLLLMVLLMLAAAASARLVVITASANLLSAPAFVYVVCAAMLVGPIGALAVGLAYGVLTVTDPPEARVFHAGLGMLQGGLTAAVAAGFQGAGPPRDLLVESAAVSAACAAVWIAGQAGMFLARAKPMREFWRGALPYDAGDFLVALVFAPALILLEQDVGIVALALFVAVLLAAGLGFRVHRKHLLSLNAEIEELSRRDSLTGVANRRAFTERLTAERLRAVRSGRPFGLLLLDLDDFKQVNDRHGHLAGDQLLAELARRLQTRLRREDLLARFGGDEFAVIVTEAANREAVETVATALIDATRTPFTQGQQTLDLSISIGAILADADLDDQQLLQAADAALYQAKAEGRNRLAFAHRGASHLPSEV